MLVLLGIWLCGGWLSAACGKAALGPRAPSLVFVGVGGLLSLMAVAVALFLLPITVSRELYLGTAFLFLLALAVCGSLMSRHDGEGLAERSQGVKDLKPKFATFLPLLAVSPWLVSGMLISFSPPIEAWDAVRHGVWGKQSYSELAILVNGVFGMDSAGLEARWLTGRVPGIGLLSLSAQQGSHFKSGGQGIAWFLLYTSTIFVVVGYSEAIQKNPFVSIIVGCVTASIPLFENHALRFGYLELLITAQLLAAIATGALAYKQRSKLLLALSLSCMSLLLITKSTGLLLVVAMLVALVILFARARNFERRVTPRLHRVYTKLLAVTLILVVALCLPSFAALLNELFERNVIARSWSYFFQSVTSEELNISASAVMFNWVHSGVVKSSFSLLWALPLIWLYGRANTGPPNKTDHIASFVVVFLLVAFGIYSGLQATPYFFYTATPSADTLFSRTLLSASMTAVLLIPSLVSRAHRACES